jgi:hypothetical protein
MMQKVKSMSLDHSHEANHGLFFFLWVLSVGIGEDQKVGQSLPSQPIDIRRQIS